MTVGKNFIFNRGAFPFADHVDNLVLGTTAQLTPVPASARYVVINSNAQAWIREDLTGIEIVDSTGEGNGMEIIMPGHEFIRRCIPGSTLHVFATTGAKMSFAYYADPDQSTI